MQIYHLGLAEVPPWIIQYTDEERSEEFIGIYLKRISSQWSVEITGAGGMQIIIIIRDHNATLLRDFFDSNSFP